MEEGYHIELAYLRLRSPQLALRRIVARVRQGGHAVPRADERIYRPLADEWAEYDNSGEVPKLLDRWP